MITKKDSTFDVIIVGGGPAGLFAAYYLSEHSNLKILLIEKGKAPLSRRHPPHGAAAAGGGTKIYQLIKK